MTVDRSPRKQTMWPTAAQASDMRRIVQPRDECLISSSNYRRNIFLLSFILFPSCSPLLLVYFDACGDAFDAFSEREEWGTGSGGSKDRVRSIGE